MATKQQKMQVLLNTLGFDEAMKHAPNLTDDADEGNAAEKQAAAEAAEVAKLASTNPFQKGPNFNLAECGRLLRNPKTQKLARSLAKSAGFKLTENDLTRRDLHARLYEN